MKGVKAAAAAAPVFVPLFIWFRHRIFFYQPLCFVKAVEFNKQ